MSGPRQILVMGHTDPTAFLRGAMDPPSEAAVAAAMQTLADVQAVGPTGPRATPRARAQHTARTRGVCRGADAAGGKRGRDAAGVKRGRDAAGLNRGRDAAGGGQGR